MVLAVIKLILEEKPIDSSKHSFFFPPLEVCYFADQHKKVQTIDGSLLATVKLNCSCTFPTSPPQKTWTNSTRTEFSPFSYK